MAGIRGRGPHGGRLARNAGGCRDIGDAGAGLRPRSVREAKATVEGFFEGAREHRKRWNALREEARQRTRQGHATSLIDLSGYRPLADFARRLRETGKTIDGDEERYKRHLERIRNGPARLRSELKWLERRGPFDRFASAMDRLDEARERARKLGVLAFHDNAYPGIIAELEQLEKERKLDAPARKRLLDVLAEHAARASEWTQVQHLLDTLARLENRILELKKQAAHEKVPMTLLRGWPDCRDESLYFEEDALFVLGDQDLEKHWRSRPEVRERIRESIVLARERQRLPELEEERIAAMVHDEMARLRDPDARHVYLGDYWRSSHMLVAGDRLRLRLNSEEPKKEAIVLRTGWSGGQIRDDWVELEWLATELEPAATHQTKWISVWDLECCTVHRARWSDERLREAELERQTAKFSRGYPIECGQDIVVGDRLCWAEIVEPESGVLQGMRRPLTERAKVVQFEGILTARTGGMNWWDSRCLVNVRWRSDGEPCEPKDMSLGELTGRGCRRAFWSSENERLVKASKQTWELREEWEKLRRQEKKHERQLYYVMRL